MKSLRKFRILYRYIYVLFIVHYPKKAKEVLLVEASAYTSELSA
ncbi:MAG TPA: hypothetical protein PKJ08_01995 [Candidatus Cloacimonadota bacterium]|nr:hypothetical protein [Candidatus Cloacimonadota bacterium]